MPVINDDLFQNFQADLPEDHRLRLQALDPTQSFIVQAPAGSGKTELLTQRYLTLLASAQKFPEEIIAITFTRKAANEMRCRILAALEYAANNSTPATENDRINYHLATKVLARDRQLGWHLLDNPNRLRIQTIDAFCARLTAQMPLLSGFGGQPAISDNLEELYRKAAQACLTSIDSDMSWASSLATLLLHLDNDFNKIESLFVEMLKKRDQWLPYVMGSNPRVQLEQALQNVILEQLVYLNKLLKPEIAKELFSILKFVSHTADESYQLQQLQELTQLPQKNLEDFAKWQAIGNFLLTRDKTWRKRFTIKEGIPGKNSPHATLGAEIKEKLQTLLSQFDQNVALHQQFVHITELPPPYYSDQQWQLIEALVSLLPILVAELHLLFKAHHVVDHIEVSLKALQALGELENPSDLALALDYRIRHMLVDEFQDTAITQFRLLELLTTGWEPNDGRTLFLVGDPMQSIYRFRKAEVSLFLQAKHQGIGHIRLTSIQLSVNFRSIQPVVDWINETFKIIFPEQDDLISSSIAFTAAKAHKKDDRPFSKLAYVDIHPFIDAHPHEQGNQIVEIIRAAWQEKSDSTIAILVQARTHLQAIIPILQKHHINYHAVEIEKLSNRAIIQDLLALTKALLHLGNRTAWLAILRAPWCGLTLADLLVIAENSTTICIWPTLENYQSLALSADGKKRLDRILPILSKALQERRRIPLARWIETTWLALGGPAVINHKNNLADAQAFFGLLQTMAIGDEIFDFNSLERELENLAAVAQQPSSPYVEIMTVHKAKGLQFDVVILPGLERKTSTDAHQLLLWQERQTRRGTIELLLAPIKQGKTEPIYDYLRSLENQKAQHELIRLFYVAATRAKQELHLLASVAMNSTPDTALFKKPIQGCLLEPIWQQLEPLFINHYQNKKPTQKIILEDTTDSKENYPLLRRLVSDWHHPLAFNSTEKEIAPRTHQSIHYFWENSSNKIIGMAFHLILQKMGHRPESINRDNIFSLLNYLGINPQDLETSVSQIERGINNTMQDKRGCWILADHQEAQSEFAITLMNNNEVEHLIIDRCFVENGIRWIIDFKTSYYDGPELERFLDTEQAHYRTQLERYARAFRAKEKNPIRLGLYFPMLCAWREWEFEE